MMGDYKEGNLYGVGKPFKFPCNSIVRLYFEGTGNVILVTMATHTLLNFSVCKLSEKLIR